MLGGRWCDYLQLGGKANHVDKKLAHPRRIGKLEQVDANVLGEVHGIADLRGEIA